MSATQAGNRFEQLVEEDRQILQHELDLLCVLHHRNKNQHHGAAWYKHLKYLKSSLTRILFISATLQTAKLSKLETARSKSLHAAELRSFFQRYKSVYVTFSRIIGTGQYVALGMVLLGVLARVWRVLKGRDPEFDPEEEDPDCEELNAPGFVTGGESADQGIVISRGGDVARTEEASSSTTGSSAKTTLPGIPAKRLSGKAFSDAADSGEASYAARALQRQHKMTKKQEKKKKPKRRDKDEIDSIFG